jgi:hypothetical protein
MKPWRNMTLHPDGLRDHLQKLADEGVIPGYCVRCARQGPCGRVLFRTSVGELDKKMLRRIHGGMAWMHTDPSAWDHSPPVGRLRVFRAMRSWACGRPYFRDHGAA